MPAIWRTVVCVNTTGWSNRILGLNCRDRVYRVGTADRLGARLREADVADLAGVHELGHRSDRVLDRRLGVDAVLVVEVDVIDAEAAERSVARAVHVGRAPVDRPLRPSARLAGLQLDAEPVSYT